MYAIIETGGKQIRVEPGHKVRVERLRAEVGERASSLTKCCWLRMTNKRKLARHMLKVPPVTARVLDHGRDKKIRVIKMKRRKNYRRTYGHRQDFTELEILSIGAPAEKKTESESATKEDDSAEGMIRSLIFSQLESG